MENLSSGSGWSWAVVRGERQCYPSRLNSRWQANIVLAAPSEVVLEPKYASEISESLPIEIVSMRLKPRFWVGAGHIPCLVVQWPAELTAANPAANHGCLAQYGLSQVLESEEALLEPHSGAWIGEELGGCGRWPG